jgi:hypothetical protein
MNVCDSRSLNGRVRRLGWRWLWPVAAHCLHVWLRAPLSTGASSGARFDHGLGSTSTIGRRPDPSRRRHSVCVRESFHALGSWLNGR